MLVRKLVLPASAVAAALACLYLSGPLSGQDQPSRAQQIQETEKRLAELKKQLDEAGERVSADDLLLLGSERASDGAFSEALMLLTEARSRDPNNISVFASLFSASHLRTAATSSLPAKAVNRM